MHVFMLTLIGLTLTANPIDLPNDVYEINNRKFNIPLQCTDTIRINIEWIRLLVSNDRGKTWKSVKDYRPTAQQMTFIARRNGVYWFAIQVLYKDGTTYPANIVDLAPRTEEAREVAKKLLELVMKEECQRLR